MPELLFSNPYPLILTATLLLSPFILSLASRQSKETKKKLKLIFISILATQILLGFLNWENFTSGRSGFGLALTYPDSLLGLFFVIAILQLIFLIMGKSFYTVVVVLNFINSVLIFMGMIRLSSSLGFQAVSLPSVGAVFLVLAGNITALAFINKDTNLLKKYLR